MVHQKLQSIQSQIKESAFPLQFSIHSKSHSDKKQVIQAHLLLQKINMTLESVGLLKQQGDGCDRDRVATSQLGSLNLEHSKHLQTS